MPRIIMVSGKGGVGKTTVAAATAVAAAERGHRTLVMSFDLAHSLSDSFNLDTLLFDQAHGRPRPITDRLAIQEIDVQEELERNWSDIYKYTAQLMVGGGMDEVVAEEVAIMPGMEDIIALMHLNDYIRNGDYDVIVVDSPPTSEALRFVSISGTLDWYIRKRFRLDRKISDVVRPALRAMGRDAKEYVPEDSYFGAVQRMFARLDGVDKILRDPRMTTVRLVTNAEKMVVRETQRAFMYFSMYGTTIDQVVVNRLFPASENEFLSRWATSQAEYLEQIREYFAAVPVETVPMFESEVIGLERLSAFGKRLFGDRDPTDFFRDSPSFDFKKNGPTGYTLEVKVPFAREGKIDVSRRGGDVVIRIGSFKRMILLPRTITGLALTGTRLQGDILMVHFAPKTR